MSNKVFRCKTELFRENLSTRVTEVPEHRGPCTLESTSGSHRWSVGVSYFLASPISLSAYFPHRITFRNCLLHIMNIFSSCMSTVAGIWKKERKKTF